MAVYYKREVIQGQIKALHDYLSAMPFSSGDVGVYLEVLDDAIDELFERRDNDDVDDVGLSEFDPNAEDEEHGDGSDPYWGAA